MEEQVQKDLQMDINHPINVTLTAGEWSSILTGIDELPRRIAQPLFDKINRTLIEEAKLLFNINSNSHEKGDEKVKSKDAKSKQPSE